MLAIKQNRIVQEGIVVGYYRHHKARNCTLQRIEGLFDAQCSAAIRKLDLPEVFDYVWLADIAVKPKWRRTGIATRVIDLVATDTTLIACGIGSGSLGNMRMRHTDRVQFYKDLGFKIVFGKHYDYAFRFGTGKSNGKKETS
jgi:GNAT superfamily N-acetyltransferase